MASRSNPTYATALPARGYFFLALLFAVALVIVTSIAIYLSDARLGYNYAVHAAIFFPLARGNRYCFLIGMLASIGLVYLTFRTLKRRQLRGFKLLPWWIQIVLVGALGIYLLQVLQIDIGLTPGEEYAKGTRPP